METVARYELRVDTLFNLHYHEVLCKDVNSFPFENMSKAES